MPAYYPSSDCIRLPFLRQFETPEDYYATLFDELIHSTGHPKRLNRFAVEIGSKKERYSFEELVAEFGAAFLCAECEISNARLEGSSASYIGAWSEVLRKDKHLILRA